MDFPIRHGGSFHSFLHVYQAGYIAKSDPMILETRWFPMGGIPKSSIKNCHFPSKTHRVWGSPMTMETPIWILRQARPVGALMHFLGFESWPIDISENIKLDIHTCQMFFFFNMYVHLCSSKLGLCSLLICFTKLDYLVVISIDF